MLEFTITESKREELCWFELDYPNVYLNWDKLEPAIASWIFLLQNKIQKMKKHSKETKQLQKVMDAQVKHIHNLQEHCTWLIEKCKRLEVQNRALIEYRK